MDRLGLALVAPRRAFAEVEEGRGGAPDAAMLLVLRFVCGQAADLVATAWMLLVIGPLPAVSLLSRQLQGTLGTGLLLWLLAGVVITIAAGKRRSVSRDFDLAAVAWMPYLAVEIVVALVVTAFDLQPSRRITDLVGAVAMGWMAGWMALAIKHARARRVATEGS